MKIDMHQFWSLKHFLEVMLDLELFQLSDVQSIELYHDMLNLI